MVPVIFRWTLAAILIAGVWSGSLFSQNSGDALLGRWLTEKAQAEFEFFRVGSEYRARMKPLRKPDLRDTKNRVDSLKGRSLNGATTIGGLIFNPENGRWQGGWVYNPEDGRTYNCTCFLKDNGARLHFRGFLGVSLLGGSQTWTRPDGDGETGR